MNMHEKMEALKKPFKASEIEWMITALAKDKQTGLAVPYVSNRAVQSRLDEIFGIGGWQNEYQPWKERKKSDGTVESSQLCGISIYDDEKKQWITRWDGAADTDIEPIKGGLSAAMKRAASMFGIGRYLYDIEPSWVSVEPFGKSYRIVAGHIPSLPAWALPDGEKNPLAHDYSAPTPQNPAPTPPPTPSTGQGSGKKLTERQLQRAFVKGRYANRDESVVRNDAVVRYNKALEDLNRDEYDDLCRFLDTLREN